MDQRLLSRRQFLQRAGGASVLLTAYPLLAACVSPSETPVDSAATTTAGEETTAPGADQIPLVMANYGAIPDGWYQLGDTFMTDHPDIHVEFEGVQANSWGDYFDKLVIQFAAGTPPDLARVAIEGTQLMAHRGVALPLDDYIAVDAEELQPYFDDIAPNMLQSMSYLGRQYQLPFTWNGPVIHYNKRLFAEAGIERPADDWAVDEFLEIARALTTDEVYGFATVVGYWPGAIPWIFAAGSDLLNDDWTESRANDPMTVEAIQFNHDLIWDYGVAPQVGPNGNDLRLQFAAGQIAMLGIGGGNLRLALINDGLDSVEDFDILYFPKWRTQTHEYGGTGFPIMRSSPNPDAAWELTKFLIQRESIIA
ncbi:MAG: sugar ABC transporter substrate-binding protein, partial [Caldilineaceae bacterium]|nr:sugar ABC transporter substrate-binding protein [Caldilineaceae bacterium]